MKKYLIASVLVIITSLISCNVDNYLDIPQQGVLAVKDTYTNADDEGVKSFISAIYYKIHGNIVDYMGWSGNTTTCYLGIRDVLEGMAGDQGKPWTYLTNADGRSFLQLWSYYYSTIYWCNMIIEYVPGNMVASQAVKGQVIAEARSIRAIMMMYLVQLWGNPPLADHIMTGSEGNTPAADSWTFIENELSEAAEGLPSKSDINGQSAIGGRLTKEADYAYLGKAYLWQGKYSEAASTLYNKVIATDLYGLVDDFTELSRYTSDFCEEYLWEYDIENVSGMETSQAGQLDVTFNWVIDQIYAPDFLYNGIGWGSLAYPSKSFGRFFEAHDTLSNGTRSNRYSGTMATYEELLDESIFTYSSGKKGLKSGLAIENTEGYFCIKLLPRWENIMGGSTWSTQFKHNNPCFMRYAEVLLNYAEAVAMGGTSGAALNGLQALNLVRERAGVPDAPALDMDNSTYGVKAERRAELFLEGSRFIDLVRWGDAAGTLTNVGRYTKKFWGYLDGNNSVIQSKSQYKIDSTATTGLGFKAGKDELFPIPTVDISSSGGNLKQNPNW